VTQKKKSRFHGFKGILATPFPDFSPHLLMGENERRELKKKFIVEEMGRIGALFKHYGIPVEAWHRLVLALAQDYVPAFQAAPPSRGRKQQWHDSHRMVLTVEIRRLQEKMVGQAMKNVCAALEQQEPWKSFIRRLEMNPGKQTYDAGETLYRQSRKADTRWAAIAWKAYLYAPEEWPSTLDQVFNWGGDGSNSN
jgi:hypothetical protein